MWSRAARLPRPPRAAANAQADVVTVSTLITCCEAQGDWRRAQEVWTWMQEQARVGGRGGAAALQLAGRLSNSVGSARSCTNSQPALPSHTAQQGLEPDTICFNTMIACMERCNQVGAAGGPRGFGVVWCAAGRSAACSAARVPCSPPARTAGSHARHLALLTPRAAARPRACCV